MSSACMQMAQAREAAKALAFPSRGVYDQMHRAGLPALVATQRFGCGTSYDHRELLERFRP